jgi:hypothetical protein
MHTQSGFSHDLYFLGATEAARAYLALQKRNEEMCIHEVNAAKAEARRKQSELELESRDLA